MKEWKEMKEVKVEEEENMIEKEIEIMIVIKDMEEVIVEEEEIINEIMIEKEIEIMIEKTETEIMKEVIVEEEEIMMKTTIEIMIEKKEIGEVILHVEEMEENEDINQL